MNNLLSNLYHWLHGQDENFVTEAFAFIVRRLLEVDTALGNKLVKWLCFPADDPVSLDDQHWEVTLQETVNEGRPDIWLRSDKAFVLVEVKKRSGLGKKQLERYRNILNKSEKEIKRLVLLTESPVKIGENAEKPDYEVRWHKVAEWLRGQTSADPVANFLMKQFTEFLEDQRMAVEQIGKEYLVGVEAFLRLVTMLEKSIEDCGLGFARSYQKNRFGFYLDKPKHKAFLVYINYKKPNLLLFRFEEAKFDKDKFLALGLGKMTDEKALFEFDLAGQTPDFFTQSADDQIKLVTEFIKGSFEKATGCISTT